MSLASEPVLSLLSQGGFFPALKQYVADRRLKLAHAALHTAQTWEDVLKLRGAEDEMGKLLKLESDTAEYLAAQGKKDL
jgi:hypothetical protein